ncbi:thioredoxin-like domain-containing protein [Arcticibacter eurypsychrophilus]|uniref:thioredoxin-like domain-containing protein n=1 Tax=Arcticibacter eurypsychrophilus TaxID=1434752 RepID=UPI001FDEF023|nr:thioredoxin-like domain-containing protein [Arcticibacter eurypsychrophilus]
MDNVKKMKVGFMKMCESGIFVFLFVFVCNVKSEAQDVTVKIHILGVYESKITLLPLVGANALKPLVEKVGIKSGEISTITVLKDRLPGTFVLRFDYKEKESSTPYPSEKYIFINNQNLELWVQPKAVSNPDSTYFQKDEMENSLFASFSIENAKRKQQIGLLQNFLMAYDKPQSPFYNTGIQEYETRRVEYNQWITSQINQHKEAFISTIFPFQYVQPIDWKGKETDRINSLMAHYFDNMDFKDPLLVKTAELKEWMDKYVNFYGAMSTTIALRDSLFTLAGKRSIEKAKSGHPLVYGWVVDYFYKGYEGFNIPSGIKMLEPYLQDPKCLTSKRLEIEKRLQGIESIRPGIIAPDFLTTDKAGKAVQFLNYKTDSPYKLVLFWSADCQHCKELMEKLQPLYQQIGGKDKMEVFALSLDFTDVEIKAWEDAKLKLVGWKHSRPKDGINSPEANAYYVLATPVMILVDSKTNKIVALPDSAEQLEEAIKKIK